MTEMKIATKKLLLLTAAFIVLAVAATSGAIADRLFLLPKLDNETSTIEQKLLKEESVVVDVAEKVSPSVVTVAIQTPSRRVIDFDPFEGFVPRVEGGVQQDIGTGFVVSDNGVIVTNKHVVSQSDAKYKVITQDDKEYEVTQILRDPNNDVAILKIDANGLKPVELGDSNNLKVGQFVIAIGTALGEFRHTVTTGVISGLGRGIVAGSVFEGYVEQLENVIQTDAAINPGNSGGPLLNSAGQVIGVNVAVAQGAENIGFAIPIEIVRKDLEEFNATGKLPGKPFLGVRYEMIPRRTALLNDVPEGAYVLEVVFGSPADKAGIQEDDIITSVNGDSLNEDNSLADVLENMKVGDRIELDVWRNSEELSVSTTLTEFSE